MDNVAKEARAEAAVTLLDVLRVLDIATLEQVFKTDSRRDFAGARLACQALRQAHDHSVRTVTVRASHRIAHSWRPGQRSPLTQFPFCTSLHVDLVDNEASLRHEIRMRRREHGVRGDGNLKDMPGQDTLARMALLGTTAEGRARITKLSVSLRGDRYSAARAMDIVGVLAALVPALPGLKSINAGHNDVLGLGAGDHVCSALLHSVLAAHAPRLQELYLPATWGILSGVRALADCSCLTYLYAAYISDTTDIVLLRPAEVAGLSALPALEELTLRAHDPTPEGANLAALIGARRPRALRRLELRPSVAERAGAPMSELDLPPVVLEFVPGRAQIKSVSSDDDLNDADDLRPCRVARLARVLAAAAASLPRGCDDVAYLRLQTYNLSRAAIREPAGGEEGPGALESRLTIYLGAAGHLPRLLARCGRVEVDCLDASAAVSPAAVCAALRVLGMPVEQLCLHHGIWPLGATGLAGGADHTAGGATLLLQEARQPAQQQHKQAAAAAAAAQQQAATGDQAAAQELRRAGAPMQLDTADAEGVLRDAVERLWQAAASSLDAAGPKTRKRGGGSRSGSCSVMLRGVPSLQPPPQPLVPRLDNSEAAAQAGAACASVARWLDALLAPAPALATEAAGAEAAAPGVAAGAPSRRLSTSRAFASVPCAGALLLECSSAEDAAALAEQVTAAGAGAGGGDGGVASALAAVVLPRHLADAVKSYDWSCCGDLVRLAVLSVLVKLWTEAAEPKAVAGAAVTAEPTAASDGRPGDTRHGLHGAALERMRLVLELDAAAAGLWGIAREMDSDGEDDSPYLIRLASRQALE
ncbi:hypothetical protein HXX76_013188 [Chlamydomonas incerta]|uniref:Uncharacterized protein n=1 Tax=Chlamydomonas incerta TaxID=51695 RepID=A0A835VR78_CHLIN|nr:hypothetical protein HXX76_013188 [Chlamydomonas incerta]|eukprot:KAG2426207.1 hypothetical protein HXX76_013188 [Chlamydomonas incerta]